MSSTHDPGAVIGAWLSEGPTVLRDDVLAAALADVHRTRQRRLRFPWSREVPGRLPFAGIAVAAVAVVAVGIAAVGLTGGGPFSGGPGPVPPATPSPSPSPSPTRTPVTSWTMDSALYPYAIEFPAAAVTIRPTLATIPWDGSSPCIVGDLCTDWIGLDDAPTAVSRELWGFGAPTTLGLDAFAADMQQRITTWEAGASCPAEPVTTRDLELDGVPARLHAFSCPYGDGTDLHLRVFAVRDGFGLVLGQAKPGSGEALDEAEEIDRLLASLAGFRWKG